MKNPMDEAKDIFIKNINRWGRWFCDNCKNYWETMGKTEQRKCPSCSSTKVRGWTPNDPTDKSEVDFML